MSNVIHAEMFFNNQRALAEQSKKLANPRKVDARTTDIGGKHVDIKQLASFEMGDSIKVIDDYEDVFRSMVSEFFLLEDTNKYLCETIDGMSGDE